MRRRRKSSDSGENHERWLVSYADFITLLFAFFVVMYAISHADVEKLKKASKSVQQAFESVGAQPGQLGGAKGDGPKTERKNKATNQGSFFDRESAREDAFPSVAKKENRIQRRLEEALSVDLGARTSDQVAVTTDERGVVIQLSIEELFDEGQSRVHRDVQPVLTRVGEILADLNLKIQIAGHSDPSEPTGIYPDSWALSTARARWVAKNWMKKFQYRPENISILGYGEYRPKSSGDRKWEKGSNRRIEIIVVNKN